MMPYMFALSSRFQHVPAGQKSDLTDRPGPWNESTHLTNPHYVSPQPTDTSSKTRQNAISAKCGNKKARKSR